MYKSRQIFIAAQLKIISKTNGLLPVALVTKWVVELCSPEQFEGAVVGLGVFVGGGFFGGLFSVWLVFFFPSKKEVFLQ